MNYGILTIWDNEGKGSCWTETTTYHTERVKFIRQVVGERESVVEQMALVVKAHWELDFQCCTKAEAASMEVDNLTVTDVAYPLVTKRLTGVFQQQLVHVHNGCISDDPECLPYE